MDNLPKNKSCLPCQIAPIIGFIGLNLFCRLTDRHFDPKWICLHVVLGFLYLFRGFAKQEIDIEKLNPKTVFLAVFFMYMFVTTVQMLLKDNMNGFLLSLWLSSTSPC